MLFFRLSCNWNLKENLGTHLRDNHAYKLSRDFELFWTLGKLVETKAQKVEFVSNFLEPFSPPLSQTLAKSNYGVSLLTKISELKFDHRFGCPFYIKICTPTFAMLWAIWTPSSPTLVKMHDGVSLLLNFSEIKFDHRFGFPFDR